MMENQKEQNAFSDFIQNKFKYFYRDELDTRHKILNTLMLNVLLIDIPFVILKAVLGISARGVALNVAIFFVVLFFIWSINRNYESEVPIVIFGYLINLIILPLMYVFAGGMHSGMIIWMLFGNVMMWVLVKGSARKIGVTINYVIICGCVAFEFLYPTRVLRLTSTHKEGLDVLLTYIVVTAIIGTLMVFLIYLYEKNEEIIKEKDKALMDANSNLESINVSLSQVSDAKSNFLANMSHEIRTPINAILGMSEMILRESDDKQILQYANDIDGAGQHLLALVNDILDFSKLESGKMEIHPVEYEMFSIINDTYNIVLPRAKRKDLKLIVENDTQLPAILYGDETRIRQIIMNILSNAIKYTVDGYVKISYNFNKINAENIELVITVKDTGIGISRSQQEKMFESFERVDILNHRDIEGAGVGLTITKRLLSLMGGRITVESQEGVGSEFVVIIPQRIAGHCDVVGDFSKNFKQKEYLQNVDFVEELKNQAVSSSDDKPKLDGQEVTGAMKLKSPSKNQKDAPFRAPEARILIVDDVKMNLNVVRLLLKNTEIQIDLAQSGQESLKYTMMKHYDLILMDHMMPEMDGIEAMHKIKDQSMGLNADTPIVVLTANAIQNVEEMYREEGFADYLSKPVKSDKLEQALFKYLPKEKVIYTDLLAGLTKKDES